MSVGLAITIGCVILAPLLWFLAGFLVKILWSLWPLFACVGVGAYVLWQNGMTAFIAAPSSILAGILVTFLWQRTNLFLSVDNAIGKRTFLD